MRSEAMMKKLLVTGMVSAGVLLAGCNTTPVQDGAVVGGALGAGLGAIVGHQSGRAGEGALIGAGAGALTGALVGDQYHKTPTTTYRKVPVQRQVVARGHYETRLVRTPSGETYEERVWVPARY
jgi:uncharacterized protein YcfJ